MSDDSKDNGVEVNYTGNELFRITSSMGRFPLKVMDLLMYIRLDQVGKIILTLTTIVMEIKLMIGLKVQVIRGHIVKKILL